jgi:hypothetical protein
MLLMTYFAIIAVILAAVGLYGLISYSVSQRAHEIGIRMALGARQADIFKLILGYGLKLAIIGISFIGVVGAYALTRVMKTLLFQRERDGSVTFIGMAALLLVIAVLAKSDPGAARDEGAPDGGSQVRIEKFMIRVLHRTRIMHPSVLPKNTDFQTCKRLVVSTLLKFSR